MCLVVFVGCLCISFRLPIDFSFQLDLCTYILCHFVLNSPFVGEIQATFKPVVWEIFYFFLQT